MEEAYERKRAKYQDLVGECQQRDGGHGVCQWKLVVEVSLDSHYGEP